MDLSIDPDAIRLPVGSNLAAKISPECPESSITGACNPLVRGACKQSATTHGINQEIHTLCTRALPDALRRASAPVEELTFCRLTSDWDMPGSSSAGRFSADILRCEKSPGINRNKVRPRNH